MGAEGRGSSFQDPGEAYKDYTVYDQHYEKVGKVDDLFVDESDQPEYIGVKMGLLGTKSTLIPIELVRMNDRRKLVEIAADEGAIKDAPTFDNDADITPDYEDRVYGHFGLERPHSAQEESSGYGNYYASSDASSAEAYPDEELRRSVDTEYGERAEPSEHPTAGTTSGDTGQTNVDIPPGDAERTGGSQDYPPREETAASSGDPAGTGETRPTEEGRQVEVQGDRNVRVYKRTRAGRG